MGGTGGQRVEGLAIWRQSAQALEAEIAGGVYGPGDRLPTEAQMATRFGVNRHTVRRAIGTLSEQGRLRVDQGRGTFVQEAVLTYPLGRRTRFTQNVTADHRMPGRSVLRSEIVKADSAVARNLGLRKGSEVALLQTLGEADGRPVVVGLNYLPARRFAAILEPMRETGSMTEALQRLGVTDYRRVSTRITARQCNAETARHLKLPPNSPILRTESIDADTDGRIIKYGIADFAGDRVQLTVEPNSDPSSG